MRRLLPIAITLICGTACLLAMCANLPAAAGLWASATVVWLLCL